MTDDIFESLMAAETAREIAAEPELAAQPDPEPASEPAPALEERDSPMPFLVAMFVILFLAIVLMAAVGDPFGGGCGGP